MPENGGSDLDAAGDKLIDSEERCGSDRDRDQKLACGKKALAALAPRHDVEQRCGREQNGRQQQIR